METQHAASPFFCCSRSCGHIEPKCQHSKTPIRSQRQGTFLNHTHGQPPYNYFPRSQLHDCFQAGQTLTCANHPVRN